MFFEGRELDVEADIAMAQDRGETIDSMQPMRIGDGSLRLGDLRDLAIDLALKAAAFRSSLPVGVRTALAQLVRAMNCYYSNLIEGHDTHPIDIERALRGDLSADPVKRDLQIEARAHIAVQQWIDDGGLAGRAYTRAGLEETHQRFCAELPFPQRWHRAGCPGCSPIGRASKVQAVASEPTLPLFDTVPLN